MANEKVKVEFIEKRLDKDGRHVETKATKEVPAKFRKHFAKWGWKELGPATESVKSNTFPPELIPEKESDPINTLLAEQAPDAPVETPEEQAPDAPVETQPATDVKNQNSQKRK